jgi:hypothetical protein
MPGATFFIAQAAAAATPAPAAAPPPDIAITAHVEARSVKIAQQGRATLTLHVEPGVTEPVHVERSAPAGARNYRNFVLDLTAQARIADPAAPASTTDTPPEQGNQDNADQP